jgi:hypothetical protein
MTEMNAGGTRWHLAAVPMANRFSEYRDLTTPPPGLLAGCRAPAASSYSVEGGYSGAKRHNQIYHTFGLWNMGLRFSSVEVVHFAFGRLFPPASYHGRRSN